MTTTKFILGLKSYDFALKVHLFVLKFSNQAQVTLGLDLNQNARRLTILFTQANLTKGPERQDLIKQISQQFDVIFLLIRLGYDARHLSPPHYEELAILLTEIVKMFESWRKIEK